MRKVVQRLADVEHPWNCPHGRPTMRHVGDVFPVLLEDERKAEEHIAEPAMAVTPLTQQMDEEEDQTPAEEEADSSNNEDEEDIREEN